MKGKDNSVFCLPCHASLPLVEQMKIFEPTPYNKRKVIVSTNLAETSITIEGVVFVVDSCFTKIKMYDALTGKENLAVVAASKSNMEQRAGRAGRVKPGKCFRLCTR